MGSQNQIHPARCKLSWTVGGRTKQNKKKKRRTKPDLLPAPLGIHSQDNTRIKSIFIPRRNTRCLTNPLTNSETMRNPNKTKTKRTKGNKYLPLNIREMIGFRSRTSQSTVNNGTPLQNFDSTQPYIT